MSKLITVMSCDNEECEYYKDGKCDCDFGVHIDSSGECMDFEYREDSRIYS